MGGGGKNAASKEATLAREEEEARQARIREGTASINSIFDGGTYGSGKLGEGAVFDPSLTYYNADGSVWQMPDSWEADRTGNEYVDRYMDRWTDGITSLLPDGSPDMHFRRAIENGLYTGVESKPGFNDEFFDGIRQGYIDFARPELDKQFDKASKQATFNMARSGTLDSSMRADSNKNLAEARGTALQQLYDTGREYETNARNSIEDARADLISQLQVTGDATGAANAALSRASALATPPAYSPLTQLFTDLSSTVATQAAIERAEAYGSPVKAKYSTGLFTPSSGAVKVN